jgi:hypothetical protein
METELKLLDSIDSNKNKIKDSLKTSLANGKWAGRPSSHSL